MPWAKTNAMNERCKFVLERERRCIRPAREPRQRAASASALPARKAGRGCAAPARLGQAVRLAPTSVDYLVSLALIQAVRVRDRLAKGEPFVVGPPRP